MYTRLMKTFLVSAVYFLSGENTLAQPSQVENPLYAICAGQGEFYAGRKGNVTKCMCHGVLYDPGEESNPCWTKTKTKFKNRKQQLSDLTELDRRAIKNELEEEKLELPNALEPLAIPAPGEAQISPKISTLAPFELPLPKIPDLKLCPITPTPLIVKEVEPILAAVNKIPPEIQISIKKFGQEIEAELENLPQDLCPSKTKASTELVQFCKEASITSVIANPDLTLFTENNLKSCWYNVEYDKMNQTTARISQDKDRLVEGIIRYKLNGSKKQLMIHNSYTYSSGGVADQARWNRTKGGVTRMGDIFFVNISPRVLLKCSMTDKVAAAGLIIRD